MQQPSAKRLTREMRERVDFELARWRRPILKEGEWLQLVHAVVRM